MEESKRSVIYICLLFLFVFFEFFLYLRGMEGINR